jgi:hypothetical protein
MEVNALYNTHVCYNTITQTSSDWNAMMKWIKRTGIGKALCMQRLEQRKIIHFYDIKREIVYSLEEATNLDAMDSDFTHFAQQLMSINNIK